MGFFNFALDFINRFSGKKNKNDEKQFEEYSKFGDFLFYLSEKDEGYEDVKKAVVLCDEAIKIARNRLFSSQRIKDFNARLREVECYNKLSDEEAKELKELLEKFLALTKERNILMYQLVDFDNGLNKLVDMEKEANEIIPKLEEAEFQQRILKQDLSYLKGEKLELEEERDKLFFAMNFIYKFTIAMVMLFSGIVIILALLNVFKNLVVFFSLTLLVILVIFVVSLVYFFRRKINFEIKLNAKKQSKAVELINKKTVVYSYYTNFLRYEYNKFKVKNAEMLKTNLKEYDHYKHITTRYDSIRNIMYQTQDMLEKFLKEKKITDVNASIERFARTVDIDDKIEYCNNLNEKKAAEEAKLAEFDSRHVEIWDELTNLNVEDKTKDHIVEKVIDAYLKEAEKLVFRNDEEGENSEVTDFYGLKNEYDDIEAVDGDE